jgi:hypothetical protein
MLSRWHKNFEDFDGAFAFLCYIHRLSDELLGLYGNKEVTATG